MRVVIDANVIVSGLLIRTGRPAEVLGLWEAGAFELITSGALLAELRSVLSRPRITRRFPRPSFGLEFLDSLMETALVVGPTNALDVVPTDPSDNRVVEAAIGGKADIIVSGDSDLLTLGEYAGIPIVTPARFIAILTEMEKGVP